MLRPSKKKKTSRGVRAALQDARETYRRHSGADEPEAKRAAPLPPAEETAQAVEPYPPAKQRLAAVAQQGRQAARRLRERPRLGHTRDEPDVVLDVPKLHVDEIDLQIDELKARVALEAHVLDLLRLDVGVDAELRGVGLKIKGVDAEAHLRVRLENLTQILDRVMDTIDSNPQILQGLTDRLGEALGEVGSSAASAVGDIGEGAGSAVEGIGGIAGALAPGAERTNGRPAT
jgi:hypothetical protein